MSEREFGLELILAEEHRHKQEIVADDRAREQETQTVAIERQDFSVSTRSHIADQRNSFPFDGPGTLETLLIISDVDDFGLDLTVDGAPFVNESFTSLQDDSAELVSVAAYERTPGFVLEVGPVEFLDHIDAFLIPGPGIDIQVARQRAELELERTKI